MSQINTKTIYGDSYAPTFYRDFASSQSLNVGIGPAIYFSRGTNATYINSLGYITYADNNGIRNSEGTGAVAGTPGTMPTNWSAITPANGLVRQIVGTGTINGLNYIDIRYFGTASANGGHGILLDTTSGIGSFLGQIWNASTYLALSGGSISGLGRVGLTVQEWVGGSNVATSRGPDIKALLTSNLQRFNFTANITNSTTTNSVPLIELSYSLNAVIDITLRIAQPQYQVGVTSPTSYKPTTSTAYYGPRFDYDPVTLQCKGLLIEESRTNLHTFSEDLTQSVYTSTNGSVISTTETTPAGNSTALFFQENTAINSQHFLLHSSYSMGNGTYTFSFFLKSSNRSVQFYITDTSTGGVYAFFDPTSGTFSNLSVGSSSWTNPSASMTPFKNGWYRCTITATKNAGASVILQFQLNNGSFYTGDGTSGAYIWGIQAEAGTFATSYIPTGSGQATRNFDLAKIEGATFTSLYNQNEGTWIASGRRSLPVGASPTLPRLFQINSTANTGHYVILARGTQASITVGATAPPSVNQIYLASLGSNYAEDNSIIKVGMAYSSSGGNGAVNGILGTATNNGTLSKDMNALIIGDTGTGIRSFEGCISSITYYPSRLPDSTLQYLTK